MKQQYAVKISAQGQVTLPAELRRKIKVQEGSYIVLSLAKDKKTLNINEKPPITKYFGALQNAWTVDGDAAQTVRKLRDDMINEPGLQWLASTPMYLFMH